MKRLGRALSPSRPFAPKPSGEHTFYDQGVTSEGRPGSRLARALERGNLTAAEQAAFEIPFIPLTQARQIVELYAEKGDWKYERAALKYLRRYLDEAEPEPTLADVAQLAGVLAERAVLIRGG